MDETLARAGIFQGVDPAAAEALAQSLEPVEFPRGHLIFAEGEPGDRLYILQSGKVKLGRKSPDGRENLLWIAGPSDMFGELSIFDHLLGHPRDQVGLPGGQLPRRTVGEGRGLLDVAERVVHLARH